MFSKAKIFVLALALSTSAWAQAESQAYMSYDSIVKDLTTSTMVPKTSDRSSFNMIRIHGGLGLVTSHIFIATIEDEHYSGFQEGLEASLGINLFSPRWLVKGALRSFLFSQLKQGAHASLNEFNLRLFYRQPISSTLITKTTDSKAVDATLNLGAHF